MSYLVLARKWRPRNFDEVIGQEHVVRTLKNAIVAGRIAHAFLFTGSKGVGKTSVARILAKALNCESGPTVNPCSQCAGCKEITNGNSIDVLEIDGATHTKVDEVREIIENIKYRPSGSRFKIYIIDEVHMLSGSAFNALLKTLEEPPEHVIFIFATTEAHKIPETVLSRCQRFDFRRISYKEILSHLISLTKKEEIKISEKGLNIIIQEAEGSLRDAQSLLDQVVSYAGNEIKEEQVREILGLPDRKIFYDLSKKIIEEDSEGCLEILDQAYTFGYDLKKFYMGLVEHFRNLTVAKVSLNPQLFPNLVADEITELKKITSKISDAELKNLFHILMKSEDDINSSEFPKIIFEVLLLKLVSHRSLLSLEEIFYKLKDLQKIDFKGEEIYEFSEHVPSAKEKDGENKPDPHKTESLEYFVHTGKEIDRNIQNTFIKLIEFINDTKKKPRLGALMTQGRLVGLDREAMEIDFPKNSIYFEQIKESEKAELLVNYCKEFFGNTDFQVKIVEAQDIVSKNVAMQKEATFREEAINNPVICKALNLFKGSEIVEIKKL